jgi:hypothetical protein
MSLHISITEIQSSIVKLYLKLEQRFKENKLISELWCAMAHDISQQIVSLDALPKSFWNRLKSEPDGLSKSIGCRTQPQAFEKTDDLPLARCFESAILSEEATILKIYVPIIRSLRKNWTEQALDFYIMVKAHLARIKRVTEAFSGDPIVIRRSSLMLQNFEKEIQESQIEIIRQEKKPHAGKLAREKQSRKKQSQKTPKHPHLLVNRSKIHPGRTKPLVEKVNLRRRRARR